MKILYEDRALLVCFKPAGLPVQTKSIRNTDLEHLLKNHIRETDGNTNAYLGVVHRLDQPVQGLLVFAKTPKAAAVLSEQSRGGQMKKEYLALVKPDPDRADEEQTGKRGGEMMLRDFLLRDPAANHSAVVPSKTPGAKEARLSCGDVTEQEAYAPLCREYIRISPERSADPSAGHQAGDAACGLRLLRIRLFTGRHHQIRVQLSHAGMPVAGDQKYGPADTRFRFPALCAFRLSFLHPESGEAMTFALPPGEIVFS